MGARLDTVVSKGQSRARLLVESEIDHNECLLSNEVIAVFLLIVYPMLVASLQRAWNW
jgi:hypothetical protein